MYTANIVPYWLRVDWYQHHFMHASGINVDEIVQKPSPVNIKIIQVKKIRHTHFETSERFCKKLLILNSFDHLGLRIWCIYGG